MLADWDRGRPYSKLNQKIEAAGFKYQPSGSGFTYSLIDQPREFHTAFDRFIVNELQLWNDSQPDFASQLTAQKASCVLQSLFNKLNIFIPPKVV